VGEVGRVVAPLLRLSRFESCLLYYRRPTPGHGGVAEWLGPGLQLRLPRFDSEHRFASFDNQQERRTGHGRSQKQTKEDPRR
jgi:hypothetical protein